MSEWPILGALPSITAARTGLRGFWGPLDGTAASLERARPLGWAWSRVAFGVPGDLPACTRRVQGVQAAVGGLAVCPLLWRSGDALCRVFSESLSCGKACEVLARRRRGVDTVLSLPHAISSILGREGRPRLGPGPAEWLGTKAPWCQWACWCVHQLPRDVCLCMCVRACTRVNGWGAGEA